MRTWKRPAALVALLAIFLLPGCNANEGGEGALEAYYGLQIGVARIPLDDAPLEVCCEDGVVAMLAVGEVAVTDRDGEVIPAVEFPSQFEEPSPVSGTRYLGFSLADVDPPGALAFRWDGPFIADLHREENAGSDLMPFDPDVDVGEPAGYIGDGYYNTLEVSAARCDFERASFTMIVFEFSYLADPTQGAGILVYRTSERAVEIVNECYEPPPPPPAGSNLIVFQNKPPVPGEDNEIWVMDASGVGSRQLTDNDREDWDPAWSPDRARIAFVSNRQGDGTHLDLMVMDFAGAGPALPAVTPLTTLTGQLSARDPAWSPLASQRKIACAVGGAGFFDRIWIFDLDQPPGTPPVEISTLPQREIEHLSWSPDGTKIAFCNLGATYMVPADGATAPTVLRADQDWALDWGPMGLVLHRYTSIGQFRLVRTDAAGGGPASVTAGGTHYGDLTPSWSPMSDRIAFVRMPNEGAARLWIVDAIGTNSNAAEIPNQPAGSNTEPDWGFGLLP